MEESILSRQFIAKHWYAGVYEQFENHTNDVDFLLKVLREQTDGTPQNILEVACGGGRISVPLAQAGHTVVGFDADEHMLLRCYGRMRGIPNIACPADICLWTMINIPICPQKRLSMGWVNTVILLVLTNWEHQAEQ